MITNTDLLPHFLLGMVKDLNVFPFDNDMKKAHFGTKLCIYQSWIFFSLHILHWATESEKYIILTLFYDQNYVNLSNLKFHPLCHTKSSFFWKSPICGNRITHFLGYLKVKFGMYAGLKKKGICITVETCV
jgi:hypothetical protein